MLVWKSCPICTSELTVHLQDIFLQRQGISVPHYFCMTCESFFHVSNYVEDEEQHEADTQWLAQHPSVENDALAQDVVERLGARRIFEAGCGVGELLAAMQAKGASVEGVDPNPLAVDLAVKKGVRATTGFFNGLSEPVDAILAIDVLEHLPEPREFFWLLRQSVVDGGLIVVRVPEVSRDVWSYIKGADKQRENIWPDPFNDNSVHINGFSERGMLLMAGALGTTYHGRISGLCHLFKRV